MNTYISWTCKYLSTLDLWTHITPVQFDVHGSPLFQFLRRFSGSTNLPLTASNAETIYKINQKEKQTPTV